MSEPNTRAKWICCQWEAMGDRGKEPWRRVGRLSGTWSRYLGVGGLMERVLRHGIRDMQTEVVWGRGIMP